MERFANGQFSASCGRLAADVSVWTDTIEMHSIPVIITVQPSQAFVGPYRGALEWMSTFPEYGSGAVWLECTRRLQFSPNEIEKRVFTCSGLSMQSWES